jgi:hypothetical protein
MSFTTGVPFLVGAQILPFATMSRPSFLSSGYGGLLLGVQKGLCQERVRLYIPRSPISYGLLAVVLLYGEINFI